MGFTTSREYYLLAAAAGLNDVVRSRERVLYGLQTLSGAYMYEVYNGHGTHVLR